MTGTFTEIVCRILAEVPEGRVVTYGTLAAAAGNPRGARQVVRILHTQSRLRNLPWHRVVASGGRIALPESEGGELQRRLLESEGLIFRTNGRVEMADSEWDFGNTHSK